VLSLLQYPHTHTYTFTYWERDRETFSHQEQPWNWEWEKETREKRTNESQPLGPRVSVEERARGRQRTLSDQESPLNKDGWRERETSGRERGREHLLGPRATVEDEEDGLVLLALELLLDVGLRLTYITQSCVCVCWCTHLCVCILRSCSLHLSWSLTQACALPTPNIDQTVIKHGSNIYQTFIEQFQTFTPNIDQTIAHDQHFNMTSHSPPRTPALK